MRATARSMNGFQNKPLANLKVVLKEELPPADKPRSWSTAFEKCRKAVGWSQKQLLATAFQGSASVSMADIKRWETAHALPSIAQLQKLRAVLPMLASFDELLPLELRQFTKVAPTMLVPVSPEGWQGPPIRQFGEGLRYVRKQRGMSAADVGALMGITGSGVLQWENTAGAMVKENYDKLCEIFPELAFAPKPVFSNRFKNTIKRKGYLEAQERSIQVARANRELEVIAAPPPSARGVAPAKLNEDALNQASAAFGVARGRVFALQAEIKNMKSRHAEELSAMAQRQQDEETRMTAQLEQLRAEATRWEQQAEVEAHRMHGGQP